MSQTIADTRPTPEQREAEESRAQAAARELPWLVKTDTALAHDMTDVQSMWFLNYLKELYETTRRSLGPWREKMERWERMSESDYSDRVNRADKNSDQPVKDVFSYQNDTLGMSEGFVDFFTAQARDDIFGTQPWLAATPEGRDDVELAEQITKHAQWKLNQSSLEEALRDGIRVAAWGGTVFVKSLWIREVEVYKSFVQAAISKKTREPFRSANNDFVTNQEDFPDDTDGNDVEWKDTPIENTIIVYDNASSACLDFKDVAFDGKAPRLDLAYTPFFCRFRMGLLDVIKRYDFPASRTEELKAAVGVIDSSAREHRGESSSTDAAEWDPNNSNPQVTLVEGFVRCDLLGTGNPIRIHVIFSPDLNVLFSVDYLANMTPEGILPVKPIRIHKIPGRIFGIGYFEKYETLNDSVDRKHNVATIRTKKSAHVYTAFQREALRDQNGGDIELDPDKPFELADGKTMADLISFLAMPDMTAPMLNLRDQELQMGQMRSGITSAAQGELKGVPSASTATGTESIISRGAILLKDPIDQMSSDVTAIVDFNVAMLYANQNRDETFTWGEGRNAQLLTLKAGDVRGLKMNVTLTLVQAQNQQKLQSAQAAIGIGASYAGLPEAEKTAQRTLYVQAIASLGFRDAEDIIRPATFDAAGILAILPPDVAPIVQTALANSGLIAPQGGTPGEPAAPVILPPDS